MKNLRLHKLVRPHYPTKTAMDFDIVWVGVIKFVAKIKSQLAEIVELEGLRNKVFERNG